MFKNILQLSNIEKITILSEWDRYEGWSKEQLLERLEELKDVRTELGYQDPNDYEGWEWRDQMDSLDASISTIEEKLKTELTPKTHSYKDYTVEVIWPEEKTLTIKELQLAASDILANEDGNIINPENISPFEAFEILDNRGKFTFKKDIRGTIDEADAQWYRQKQ